MRRNRQSKVDQTEPYRRSVDNIPTDVYLKPGEDGVPEEDGDIQHDDVAEPSSTVRTPVVREET